RTLTEPVQGLPQELPPIRGLVLTTAKERADVPLVSPLPAELDGAPLVAHWQYNLGRAVAVTTDAGQKWTRSWGEAQLYRKFWGQLVRWMLRPTENENFTLSMQEKDGEVTFVVNAVDKQNEFLNFLKLNAQVVQPPDANGKVSTAKVEFRQTEPGKYEGKFRAEAAGSYFLSVATTDAAGRPTLLSSGLDISYPPEYRDLESNRDLLENLAQITDGRVVPMKEAADVDFFLREQAPAYRLQDAWPPILLIALCLFLADVAVRRIAIEPAEVAEFFRRVWQTMRRKPVVETTVAMERLRSVKAEVGEQLRTRRFEVDPLTPPAESVLGALDEKKGATTSSLSPPPPPPPKLAPEGEKKEETNFDRLLRAKQEALRKRQEERDKK
ncbi:MAG TPA: hypothetical protein VNC50_05580, partial [Planctomycetia bacterium]|nr:hypothetical protein [Planctomycetia bacterium]